MKEKRTESIRIKVSKQEKELIKEIADKTNMNISSLIRLVLLTDHWSNIYAKSLESPQKTKVAPGSIYIRKRSLEEKQATDRLEEASIWNRIRFPQTPKPILRENLEQLKKIGINK